MILNVEQIISKLLEHTNSDLSSLNTSFFLDKLQNRKTILQLPNGQSYLDYLQEKPEEISLLLADTRIKVSWFFRNSYVFECLEHKYLPRLLNQKRLTKDQNIRICSIGCCNGEEAYSIAMLLDHLLKDEKKDWNIKIEATDIEPSAIAHAKKGLYVREKLHETKLAMIDQYFSPQKNQFQLKNKIRQMVDFTLLDITQMGESQFKTNSLDGFDLVICRNLLIYFNEDIRIKSLQHIKDVMKLNGLLLLGESEWVSEQLHTSFSVFDNFCHLFQVNK